MKRSDGMSLTLTTNLFLATLLIFCTGGLVWQVRQHMREQALTEATNKAQLLLDRNLSIHAYFNSTLKPKFFALLEDLEASECFVPSIMSSTYVVREIDTLSKDLTTTSYYYKECAVNARSPQNEADPLEREFLLRLNADPSLKIESFTRKFGDKDFLVTMRRGEVMTESCMRCHSTPDRAPELMIDMYGDTRSFDRKVGDVVSAISIRIPLHLAYTNADKISKHLSWIVIFVLLIAFLIQMCFFRRLVILPLRKIHDKAKQIAGDESYLGDLIEQPAGKELKSVVRALNSMSSKLRFHMANLEQQVATRTEDLKQTNNRLINEITDRKAAEEETARANEELRSALAEVKTLYGIIPICSYCKNIRDDKGAWSQLESYIQNRTEVQFSHGVCQACFDRHHKELGPKKSDDSDS